MEQDKEQHTPQGTPGGDRIAKVLARAGVASRRAAERMIEEGRVRVNGRLIDSPALNVTPEDRLEVDGTPVGAPEPVRLWLYHKPQGLITTERDEAGRPTVFAALPDDMPRVMSVGRLDINSEGLLLLTNDGAIKRRLELPSTGWLRRYRVRVKGRPDEAMLEPLRRGLLLEGERFQPMEVTIDRQQGANAWLTVAIREGRNREVRRAMEAVGLPVNRLIRVSYGPFRLGDLAPGAVEEVRPRVVRDQLGLGEKPGAAKRKERKKRRLPRKGGTGVKAAAGTQGKATGTKAGGKAGAGGVAGKGARKGAGKVAGKVEGPGRKRPGGRGAGGPSGRRVQPGKGRG